MLALLTHYLLRYKQLTVPHVGTFRLQLQPAALNVADKQIEPPGYTLQIEAEETVPSHQLRFLSEKLGFSTLETEARLRLFGERINAQRSASGFEWKGLGTLLADTESLPIALPSLAPVAAEKIIRQDASHAVLVGDRELNSAQLTGDGALRRDDAKRRSVWVVVGWVLLLLAVVFIALWLYFGKFKTDAAGSKLPPLGHAVLQPSTSFF